MGLSRWFGFDLPSASRQHGQWSEMIGVVDQQHLEDKGFPMPELAGCLGLKREENTFWFLISHYSSRVVLNPRSIKTMSPHGVCESGTHRKKILPMQIK